MSLGVRNSEQPGTTVVTGVLEQKESSGRVLPRSVQRFREQQECPLLNKRLGKGLQALFPPISPHPTRAQPFLF